MGVFIKCRAPSSSPYGYSKMEMEDPEDLKHRQAQFLIYKVMQKADQGLQHKKKQQSSSSSLYPSNCLIKMRIICSKLKIKIGRRLKKLRKSTVFITMSAARVCVIKKVLLGQLKALKRVLACNSGTVSVSSGSIALQPHFIK